jgi:hypothetical protein
MSQTRKRKEFLMSDSSDPEAIPFILQTRCEMAAWVYLRPITWRLELVDGLASSPIFSTSGAILMGASG